MSTGTTPALALGKLPMRRVPRYKLTVPLHLSVLRSGIPDNFPGRSLEIGEGGMGVVAASRLLLGESVRVEFLLPHMSSVIRATAVVRYQHAESFGLQFLRLPVEQQSMIRYWTRCEGDVSLFGPENDLLKAGTTLEELPDTLGSLPESSLPENSKRKFSIWRILRLVLPIIAVAGVLGWWRWQEEWKELEAPIATRESTFVKSPLKVAPDIMEGRIVHEVTPEYPESARQAGVEGTVLLDVVINSEGAVTGVNSVSGPEVLSRAAMDAVRWWRYQPYLVNGQPVTIESTVTVNFRLEN
jgi:TonB family protein